LRDIPEGMEPLYQADFKQSCTIELNDVVAAISALHKAYPKGKAAECAICLTQSESSMTLKTRQWNVTKWGQM
jgi:hypothetical protein